MMVRSIAMCMSVLLFAGSSLAASENVLPFPSSDEKKAAPSEELPWLKDAPKKKKKVKLFAPKEESVKEGAEKPKTDEKTTEQAEPEKVPSAIPDDMPNMMALPPVPQDSGPMLPEVARMGTKPVYIETIAFGRDDEALLKTQKERVDAMFRGKRARKSLRLEIKSYASQREGHISEPRRIALKRAIELRKYLIEKGFVSTNINVQAIGLESEPMKHPEPVTGHAPVEEVVMAPASGKGKNKKEDQLDRIDIYELR